MRRQPERVQIALWNSQRKFRTLGSTYHLRASQKKSRVIFDVALMSRTNSNCSLRRWLDYSTQASRFFSSSLSFDRGALPGRVGRALPSASQSVPNTQRALFMLCLLLCPNPLEFPTRRGVSLLGHQTSPLSLYTSKYKAPRFKNPSLRGILPCHKIPV